MASANRHAARPTRSATRPLMLNLNGFLVLAPAGFRAKKAWVALPETGCFADV